MGKIENILKLQVVKGLVDCNIHQPPVRLTQSFLGKNQEVNQRIKVPVRAFQKNKFCASLAQAKKKDILPTVVVNLKVNNQ